MRSVVLDFETYYGDSYTLSKMTTEAYIRDPRFEVILCGFKEGNEPGYWVDGPDVGKELQRLKLQDCAVIAHHAHFDGLILSHHYNVRPKRWIDTLSMARAIHGTKGGNSLAKLAERHGLGAKGHEVVLAKDKRRADFSPGELRAYGRYCINDCELEYDLALQLTHHFQRGELNLIDSFIRMFTEPVLRVRTEVLQQYIADLRANMASLLTLSGTSLEDLRSANKFAAALQLLGVDPPLKISKTTGKWTYAFSKSDPEMQELAEHEDPAVQALVAARLGAKSTLNETRALRLIDMVGRGPACVYLNYYGAGVTGRASGGDKMNWQNNTRGSPLRKAIYAPIGMTCVVGDSSNIESRMLDWLAGQDDQVEAYRLYDAGLGPDIYCVMAEKIYGRPVTKKDNPDERHRGKTAKLGLGYGMGDDKFALTAKIPKDEASRIKTIYRQTHGEVVKFWRRCEEALTCIAAGLIGVRVDHRGIIVTSENGLRLPNGLEIKYPNLQHGENGWTYFDGRSRQKIYGGKVCVAAGTLVLTERGWIPIELVRLEDRVHDGVKFVVHGGKIYNGVQECVVVDGVHMTPDHEVLTDEGWTPAVEKPRPYRPDLRHVDCAVSGGLGRREAALALSMYLRYGDAESRGRRDEGSEARGDAELRVCDRAAHRREEPHARHEQAPGIRSMAVDAGPLSSPHTSGMEELRGAGHYRVPTLADVRGVLEGYGSDVQDGANFGKGRQQQGVHPEQLHVGDTPNTGAKQAELFGGRYPRTGGENRGIEVNPVLSTEARPVFDLVNCGPRRRFVVCGEEGPFIVHNCENIIQALARILVMEQCLMVKRKQVLSVHDEGVWVVQKEEAEAAKAEIEAALRTPLPWCKDLPLNCEVGYHQSYGRAKK